MKNPETIGTDKKDSILSESANILYKWAYLGNYPDIDEQFTLKWDDPNLDIYWPVKEPILQPRDL